MSEVKKFEELTKEQQDQIKKAGKKFIIKGLLTGMNYGGLIFFSNLVLVLANAAFFQSQIILIVLCVAVDITLLRMMGTTSGENAEEFRSTVKKVLEDK
jgi:hypothetical protein